LDAGFLIDTDHMNPISFILLLGSGMQFADILDLLGKFIPVLNVGVLPVPTAMGL
jgi:hypothetical protein